MVAVCVPTYQEAHHIGRVTRLIDEAIAGARTSAGWVIVNADNRSPDGTAKLFADVPTRAPKARLSTPEGVRGKGANLRLVMEYAIDNGFDAVITLDADLHAVPPQWLDAFLGGAFTNAPRIHLPLYGRPSNDGNLTNHIVTPLLLAVTGEPVRQPIGGDFCMNRSFIHDALTSGWPADANRFGVDVFLALHALRHARLSQVPLSVGKLHGWRNRRPQQVEREFHGKFEQIVGTLIGQLRGWPRRSGPLPGFPPSAPLFADRVRGCDPAFMVEVATLAHQRWADDRDYVALVGDAPVVDGRPRLDDEAWAGVLTRAWRGWPDQAVDRVDSFAGAFRALLYCRIATGQLDFLALGAAAIDRKIIDVAARIQT